MGEEDRGTYGVAQGRTRAEGTSCMTLARMKTVEGCHVSARRPASTQRRTRYVYRPNLTCHSRQTFRGNPVDFASRDFATYISFTSEFGVTEEFDVTDVTSL